MEQLSFVDELDTQHTYSVTELTRAIRHLLEYHFPYIWVQGEISNFLHHSSGHMYFSLKDDRAQIGCVMWRSRNNGLYFTPQDGMKVTVCGRITVYEKRGNYQLDVYQVFPAGAGELQVAFEQLKRRLHAEGLFAEERKRPLPPYPERIGIVTSPTGAAIQDMIAILRRRFPPVEIILNPVRVQGEGAAHEIARAIEAFNRYGQVDVLIVGRGGGSLEDLWAFNEEIVARAVYDSKIPVVSAVGHEVDFTICDFVADLRAPTPSAAAELVVPTKEEVVRRLERHEEAMTAGLLERIKRGREKLQAIEGCYAFHQPRDLVRQNYQRLDELRRHLNNLMGHQLQLQRERLSGLRNRLALLEHKNVLKRGYSICYRKSDGHIVRQAPELQAGAEIELQFYQGRAEGAVEKIIP